MAEQEIVTTKERAYELGYYGKVPTHEVRHDTLAGAVVNSDDAPTPDNVSGPGADMPSKQDELIEDGKQKRTRGKDK